MVSYKNVAMKLTMYLELRVEAEKYIPKIYRSHWLQSDLKDIKKFCNGVTQYLNSRK